MSKEWCEHINYHTANGDPYFQSKLQGCFAREWKQCPICGTPRPEEPKSLAEKFVDSGIPMAYLHETASKKLAEIAEAHYFPEGVEEELAEILYKMSPIGNHWTATAKKVLQFLRQRNP